MAFENENHKEVKNIDDSRDNMSSKCDGLINQLPQKDNNDFNAMSQKCFKPIDDGFSIDGDAKGDKGANKCGGTPVDRDDNESGSHEGKGKKIVKDGGLKDDYKKDSDKYGGDKEDLSIEKGKKGKVPNQDGGMKPWFQDENGKKPLPIDKFEDRKPGKQEAQPEFVKPVPKPILKGSK